MAGNDLSDLSDDELAAEVKKRRKGARGGGQTVRVWELVGADAKRAIDMLGLGGGSDDDDDDDDDDDGDGGRRRGFFDRR